MPTLNTTCVAMAGGLDAVAGTGKTYPMTFDGAWATGDIWVITITDATTAVATTIGYGTVSGLQPTFAYTLKDKVYLLAGSGLYFSAVGLPTTFNDQNATGNGFIQLANNYGTAEDLQACVSYQGKLAVISRRS